jgi:putative xylitol transport system permease protein
MSAAPQSAPPRAAWFAGTLRRYGIGVVFVFLCLAVSAICQYKAMRGDWPENVFVTTANFRLILYQISVNGILAIGMTMVIVSGGIDLSVGSVLAFTGMLGASFATGSQGVTPWSGTYAAAIPIAASLLAGAVCGALNGWIVARFRIQAFIATLGMLLAARGFTMSLTGGNPISDLSASLRWFGTGTAAGVPVPIVILICVFLCAWVVLNKTVFGRHIYAVGGNEASARTSGIRTRRVKTQVYAISGILAGLAGIILTAKTGSAQTNAGSSYELDAIAAAVIGGASLSGGAGSVSGTLFGALIMGVMNNSLDILGVESFYQSIVKGVLIVGAVILDASRRDSES